MNDEVFKPGLAQIDFKVREHHYFLKEIVKFCDRKSITPTDDGSFLFGAYANALQGIKDILNEIEPKSMGWECINRALKHGYFMYTARNGGTHDGLGFINSMSGGKFYSAYEVTRKTPRGSETISPPQEDVRTFCLEFSSTLSDLLIEMVESHSFRPTPPYRPEIVNLNVRESYNQARGAFPPGQIAKAIQQADEEIAAQQEQEVLSALRNLKAYCEKSLKIQSINVAPFETPHIAG